MIKQTASNLLLIWSIVTASNDFRETYYFLPKPKWWFLSQYELSYHEKKHGKILALWVIKFVVVIYVFNSVFKDSQQGKSWNTRETSPSTKFPWLNLMLISFILDCFLSNEFANLGNHCLMSVLVTHMTSFLGMASQLGCWKSFLHFLCLGPSCLPPSSALLPNHLQTDLAFGLFLVLVF